MIGSARIAYEMKFNCPLERIHEDFLLPEIALLIV